ncbi:HalOD1 output domain-containing protein [Halomicrococcus sp. NG-SE-24]|uniref:HalOD1 output domain-containing protein n=1 Tax=Halomicrococcus sp. NG-SE-24 TaxID=3436928 RepID=UPI003D95C37A
MTDNPTNSESLTDQVIAAVADAADCSQRELPPLSEAINPDALDCLFAPTYSGETRTDGRVTFEYAGYEVDIHSSGDVSTNLVKKADG